MKSNEVGEGGTGNESNRNGPQYLGGNEPVASGDGSLDESRVGPLGPRDVRVSAGDLWENEKGLVLTASSRALMRRSWMLPREGLVAVSGGRAGEPVKTEGEDFIRRERWYEPFKRTINSVRRRPG